MVKIVVHGAGSIGCFVGGIWASLGMDITLLGRDYIGEAIRNSGMTLTDYNDFHTKLNADDINFSTDPAILATADIIALAVKSTGTETAAAEIAAHAKEGAVVLSLQNGISNVAKLEQLLPKQIIVAGMVPFNATNMGSGHWHKGLRGHLFASQNNLLAPLQSTTKDSPAMLQLVDDMPSVAWGKLLLNLNNPLNALSGKTLANQLRERDYRLVWAATVREALPVLKVAGITPARISPLPPTWLPGFASTPNFFFNNIGLKMQKIDARARSSMAEDFDAGRRSEIDYLNGEVVKLAEKHNLEAPYNRAVVSLIKEAEAGGKKTWAADALKKHILG